MGLDMSALKAKLNQFTKQNERSDSTWKPAEGKSVIRIVPWKDNRENPFIELYFHYMGNKSYLSPTSFGNRDPIVEFADELASGGTKDDYAQARPFRAKLRTYVPVIVRGEESKGVRFMSFGKTVYQELLSIINDPDYGDITDIKNGRDIVVEHIPKEKSDTSFAKTMVRPKPKQTPLAESTDDIKKFLTEQPDIRSLNKEYTYQELAVVLKQFLGANEVEDTEGEEPQAEAVGTAAKSASLKSSKSVDELVDEFDELFKK